jgi:hypothetical protein
MPTKTADDTLKFTDEDAARQHLEAITLFTSRLDVRPKTEIIDGLLADCEVDENRREHWRLAKPLLVSLARDRNNYTHAWWAMALPDIAIAMSTRRGNPTVGVYGTKWINVADLDQAIAQAEKLSFHLTAFATPQFLGPDELLPSSYRPRQRPRRRSSPDRDEPTTPRRPPRSSRT